VPRAKKPTVIILKTKKPPTLKKLKNKAPKEVVVVVKEKKVDILRIVRAEQLYYYNALNKFAE
jgi:hypothetical protein